MFLFPLLLLSQMGVPSGEQQLGFAERVTAPPKQGTIVDAAIQNAAVPTSRVLTSWL